MKDKLTVLSKYYLIFLVISFIGWLFETIQVSILADQLVDRGFLSLPICPIYGLTIMGIYFLAGTPHEPQGILRNVNNLIYRYLSYFLISFALPTIAEFFVGMFFDKAFNIMLWDYSHLPLNIGGYVCLWISLAWGFAITLLMRIFFPILKRWIFKISDIDSNVNACGIGILMIIDIIYNVILLFANVKTISF